MLFSQKRCILVKKNPIKLIHSQNKLDIMCHSDSGIKAKVKFFWIRLTVLLTIVNHFLCGPSFVGPFWIWLQSFQIQRNYNLTFLHFGNHLRFPPCSSDVIFFSFSRYDFRHFLHTSCKSKNWRRTGGIWTQVTWSTPCHRVAHVTSRPRRPPLWIIVFLSYLTNFALTRCKFHSTLCFALDK